MQAFWLQTPNVELGSLPHASPVFSTEIQVGQQELLFPDEQAETEQSSRCSEETECGKGDLESPFHSPHWRIQESWGYEILAVLKKIKSLFGTCRAEGSVSHTAAQPEGDSFNSAATFITNHTLPRTVLPESSRPTAAP